MLFNTHFQSNNSDASKIGSNVQDIFRWLESFTDLSISNKDWQECRLAIVEGFTNVIYHAHQHLPVDTPIRIELTGYSNYLEVCIWDFGRPFDLWAYFDDQSNSTDDDPTVVEPPVRQHKESGYGLHIIRKVSHELAFHRVEDHKNCLVFARYRTASKSE